MSFPSIFSPATTLQLYERIDQLNENSLPLWGKMNAGQMLSHCCVPYEQIKGIDKKQPPLFMRVLLKLFFKKSMVNEVPYRKNLQTAPSFIRSGTHNFELEKSKLKQYIADIQEMGAVQLAATPSLSLGKLSAAEWNNLLYKHIDHHLRQFGV
jgi:hypothetical protein